MQTIITNQGQYILTAAEVMNALGIPATATLIGVDLNNNVNPATVTFTAVQQQSNTGTP